MSLASGQFKTTIRLTVVAAFILVTLFTASIALGLQYYFSESMAKRAATELYTTTASGVAAELNGISRVYANVISLLADNTELGAPEKEPELLRIFTGILEKNPMLYGAYIGRADGSLFEVVNLDNARRARMTLGEHDNDRWLQVKVNSAERRSQRSYRYLDADLNTRTTRTEDTQYSALQRSWYQSALQSEGVQVSRSYRFAQSGEPGRSISRRISNTRNVAGLDMTLASLSGFLATQQIASDSSIYLFDKDGTVIASSERPAGAIHQAPGIAEPVAGFSANSSGSLPPDLLAIAIKPTAEGQLIGTEIGREPHLFFSARMSADANALYLGIVTPVSAVMAPFREKILLSLGLTTALLLLLVPLSWFFANPIVKPVKQLARENDKVRRLQFDEVERVDSHVRELDELSASMVDMVASIQAHEKAQRDLMDAIIQLIGQAIDDKSAYTGGHCERVPELAMMLAKAADDSDIVPFNGFSLDTKEQWREYRIAAWLHDCGKITTPEHIVDKGSKLEAIYNRIHEVRMRFEVLSRDAELRYWQTLHASPELKETLAKDLAAEQTRLETDFAFVAQCNVGGEYLDDSMRHRLFEIAERTWQRRFDDSLGLSPVEELRYVNRSQTLPVTEHVLADKPEHIIERERPAEYDASLGIDMEVPEHLYNQGELYNLSVSRGTLTKEDRFKINEHMISTIKMLESLPFPDDLKNVPRYASTHHETLRGTGYPRKLGSEDLSIPERILAIADIFEALTASDRPYKRAKTVSAAIDILHKMADDEHIDRDCFELFLTSGVYLQYAQQYLDPAQLDEVNVTQYLASTRS